MHQISIIAVFFAALQGCVHASSKPRTHSAPPARAAQGMQSIGGLDPSTNSVLTIDLLANPRPDQWGTGACQTFLPADFVLGQATCRAQPELKADLLAGQAMQTCSGSEGTKLDPVSELKISGCDGPLDLNVYVFKPAISVRVTP